MPSYWSSSSPLLYDKMLSFLSLLFLVCFISLTNAFTKSSCTNGTDQLISPVIKTQNFQMWDSRCNFLVNFTASNGQLIFYQYQSYTSATAIWSAEWTDPSAVGPFSFQLLDDATFLILDRDNLVVYDASASSEWLNRVSGGAPIYLQLTINRVLLLKDKKGKILWNTNTGSTAGPSRRPTRHPILPGQPSPAPSLEPTLRPTLAPTRYPTKYPTVPPTNKPTKPPTAPPTRKPTTNPTKIPTSSPTQAPTFMPTRQPTQGPTPKPEAQIISGVKNLYFYGGIIVLVLALIFGTYIYCRCCRKRRRRRRKRRNSKKHSKRRIQEEIEVVK